jgi:hypothetical protein
MTSQHMPAKCALQINNKQQQKTQQNSQRTGYIFNRGCGGRQVHQHRQMHQELRRVSWCVPARYLAHHCQERIRGHQRRSRARLAQIRRGRGARHKEHASGDADGLDGHLAVAETHAIHVKHTQTAMLSPQLKRQYIYTYV